MTNLLQMSVFTSFMLAQFPAIAATDYEIEAASNDETFIHHQWRSFQGADLLLGMGER